MQPLEIVFLVLGIVIWVWSAVAGATIARVKGKSYLAYLIAGIFAPGIPFVVAIMSKNTMPIPQMLERLDKQMEKIEAQHAAGKLNDEKYESEKKSTEQSIEKLEWALGEGAKTVYEASVLIQTGRLPEDAEAKAEGEDKAEAQAEDGTEAEAKNEAAVEGEVETKAGAESEAEEAATDQQAGKDA